MLEFKNPLEIEVRPNHRYRVQSRTREDIKHLVKWSAAEQNYSCSCEWGSMRAEEYKDQACEHVIQVRERFAKSCNLCASRGEWEKEMRAPWEKNPLIYFCTRCDEFLSAAYRRGVSK